MTNVSILKLAFKPLIDKLVVTNGLDTRPAVPPGNGGNSEVDYIYKLEKGLYGLFISDKPSRSDMDAN